MRVSILAQRAQEDCADDRSFPVDRHDDDRANVAHRQRCLGALEHRLVCGVGDEDGFSRIERSLELWVAIEVDDQVTDGWIFVAGDKADFILLRRQKDRTSVQTERLAKLARDALEDVDEVER
jgi:hypothetical protein